MTAESLFAAAVALPPSERAEYLDVHCAEAAQRQEIEALLVAHAASNLLDRPPRDLALTAAEQSANPACEVPSRIGPYKLLEKIGEGGMGEVWVAEQTEPIKRRVALKLIKAGMDSKQVLARFEAERQALALMDHPNIARVLDAGTTSDGRPYFVMELVKGVPITRFCDDNKLSPRQRLELFVQVCQAIQHAHTKGIIHRDIKPSNVLVELHDDTPVVKVIDFGVAKAVGQPLTEKTIYTGFGALVGTPMDMAPEQATFNALDVDTRADVYALSVLLYELLTGSPPLEPERLKQAALDEVLRVVREEEPPRPSQRLSTSQAKASIAANRGVDVTALARSVAGELDWIAMKALEKGRSRRYESASALARDVERHLAGEAVEACPPTGWYRLGKLFRRHRVTVLVTLAFAGLLTVATGVAIPLAIWARQSEQAALAGRQAAQAAEEKERERANGERQAHAIARQVLYVADISRAREAWDSNRVAHARELLLRQIPPPSQPDLRHSEWYYLDRLMHPTVRRWPVKDVLHLDQLSWSPDGSRLAVGGEVRAVPSGTVTLRLHRTLSDFEAQKPVPQEVGGFLHHYTADGQWIVLSEHPVHYDRNCSDGLYAWDGRAVGANQVSPR